MNLAMLLGVQSELSARVIRAGQPPGAPILLAGGRPRSFWRRVWQTLRADKVIPLAITFAAFMALVAGHDPGVCFSLVTTAGVNYMAADFLAASANRINAFNQHDAGTGAVAANIADVGLGTPWGGARVAGTQSNPSANQYRSVATIQFNNTFAITEWGLFSSAAGPTLWDRRVFPVINVGNGDSIQFTYTLTINAGGT